MVATTETALGELNVSALQLIIDAHCRVAWIGQNLRKSMASVSPEEASWRPPGAKHNIAEIALHCAYWKNRVRHRLVGDRRKSFPRVGSDWFPVENTLSAAGWDEIKAITEEEHTQLADAISALDPSEMSHKQFDHATHHITGIAMHDAYHVGQMQLIRAMWGRE